MQYANGVAALWNAGTVVANNVVWMGNVGTVDGEGGAVHNIGSLKLINNVFTGNRAVGGGNDVRFGKEFDAAQSANFFSVVLCLICCSPTFPQRSRASNFPTLLKAQYSYSQLAASGWTRPPQVRSQTALRAQIPQKCLSPSARW